ncbi:MAG: sensor histidine kinase [Anaerolineae bacterium]
MNSLRSKLVLSYLAIALLTAALIFALTFFTSDQRLKSLVLEQELSAMHNEVLSWYEIEGDWDGFHQYFMALHPPPPSVVRGNEANREGGIRGSRGNHGIVDADKRLLNKYLNFEAGDVIPEALMLNAIPVVVNSETVAWIVPDDATGISLQAEQQVFLENTIWVVLIASLIAVSVAIAVGFGLANVLLRPIGALTQASELMAQGELEQEITIAAPDELGQLAESFTNMSREVALAHQRRRQLTADIAHDLSTPLHIASGYVETILAGDLAPTPERLTIVATELNHLRRLIEDLDLLALTDNKTLSLQLEPVSLTAVMPHVVTSFQSLALANEIELSLSPLPDQLPKVIADRARLIQVLGNILNNAMRFTPSGGKIDISTWQENGGVRLRVRDSGIGIAAADLPFVFDRFYQGDRARGQSGKMGLGLAISKGLIEAMGGEISADSKGVNQGTLIDILLHG